MAADETKLGELHNKVAEVLTNALEGQQLPDYTDPDTGEVVKGAKLEPSGAVLTAAIQFLKNNNITCAPGENNALGALEAKMRERQEKRNNRNKPDKTDLANATDQTGWLGGQMGHA